MLKGYRTYIAAALLAVFGVLAQTDWALFLQDPEAGWTAIFSAALFAALRSVTNTAPGSSV